MLRSKEKPSNLEFGFVIKEILFIEMRPDLHLINELTWDPIYTTVHSVSIKYTQDFI